MNHSIDEIYGIGLCLFKSIIIWNNPAAILPGNDDKMLVITETKKGMRQINIAYYDGRFWHGMGSMAKVVAWAYMPDVNNGVHGGYTHQEEKKAGVTDGQT